MSELIACLICLWIGYELGRTKEVADRCKKQLDEMENGRE